MAKGEREAVTPPELWWSPSLAAGGLIGDAGEWPDEHGTEAESGLIEVVNGTPFVQRHAMPWWELPALPDDAVRLVLTDTTPDDLHQVQARAFADGRIAERANPSPGPLDRIQSDPDGTVDEVVWTGTAHFEMSTDTSGYLHLTRGGAAVFLRVWVDGGRLVVREEWRDGDIGDEEDDRG